MGIETDSESSRNGEARRKGFPLGPIDLRILRRLSVQLVIYLSRIFTLYRRIPLFSTSFPHSCRCFLRVQYRDNLCSRRARREGQVFCRRVRTSAQNRREEERDAPLTMILLRSGTARKTPKNAVAQHQPIKAEGERMSGPPSSFVSIAKAGTSPTRPAASGSVPVATAVVWMRTWIVERG